MLPRTFLSQLIPARIAEALRRVEKQIWQPLPGTIEVQMSAPTTAFLSFSDLADVAFEPVPADPFHWGPKYAQRWFRLTLPAPTEPGTRYLQWDDQGEATAYLDGVPYSGLDLAHPWCPLPEGTREVWIESVCLRSGIWLNGQAKALDPEGSLYAPPSLLSRNDTAWNVSFDLRVLLELIEAEYREYQPADSGLPKPFTDPVRHSPAAFRASPLYRRLCDRLDRAIDVLDHEGLEAFAATLTTVKAEFRAAPDAVKTILTGHAHIDLVWLWPERVGESKAVHSWATQTRLLKQYPEFRFGYSQPASYEAVGRRAPALLEKVKGLIAAGQWDATGAAYVEGDTQLPCGEAILRCLRIGQDEFTQLRGSPSEVFWLPDVFGYSGCMPQLLAAVGVTGFFTTKLSWSTINRFPHTSFVWRGPDGAEVNAHVVLIHDYNEWVDVKRLRECTLHHQQSGVHPEQLIPTGYGDGGGGPTDAMLERARRVADLAGLPRVEWGNIEPFFRRLADVKPDLPVVTGELMLELHRGVFTTHGHLKSAFRALERALQSLEATHVVAGLGPIDQHYWKRAIFSHFHDYIPGSSIWEVYAEAIPELESLAAKAETEARAVLASLGTTPASHGWFNPLPVARTWLADGRCYELPPLSGGPAEHLISRPVTAPHAKSQANAHTGLASDRVQASFNPEGHLVSLEIDGHPVAIKSHALWSYADHPATFAAWDVDRTALVRGEPARRTTTAPTLLHSAEQNEASIAFDYTLASSSQVRVIYSVRATEPVLRIRYETSWNDPGRWLKAVVNTDYTGREARFGAPFGSTLRGQWPGLPREEAQWEVPGSRWMVLSDDAQNEGLAVITEAKYGFTVRDGTVGISLLRSAEVTEARDHPKIRITPDRPDFSDLGPQVIELAFGRYAADLALAEQPAMLADTLFTPCLPHPGPAVDAGWSGWHGLPSAVPAWAEPLADGAWALRVHETLGRRGQVQAEPSPGWSVVPASVRGDPTPCLGALPIKPYGLTTLRFARTSPATS